MSMKENNNQTGHESFGMTADQAAELLSKISFAPLKTTDVDPVPTLEETVIDRDKARREVLREIHEDDLLERKQLCLEALVGDSVWKTAYEVMQEELDVLSIRDLYPPRAFSYIPTTGPSPRKGGFCGHCATITDKERKKLDSCPECGKSYYAYRGGKRR